MSNFAKELGSTAFSFIVSSIKKTNKEGYVHVGVAIALTILFSFASPLLGFVSLALTVWVFSFFRDPERVTPTSKHLVISPADGLISDISLSSAPSELGLGDGEMCKISIFLSVFDVHVNRVPVFGKIKSVLYHPGKFFNATLDKASKDNERNSIVIENADDGQDIVVVQIAGLLARRIVCYAKAGDNFNSGERFGIIKFGSRVDIYLPKSYHVTCMVGQRSVGGETVLALSKPSSFADREAVSL
jgi:phosphatidylserine decarboxylase